MNNINSLQALPSIVELLRDVSSPSSVLHANCSDTILASLQFVYWSLIHLDNAQPNQVQKIDYIYVYFIYIITGEFESLVILTVLFNLSQFVDMCGVAGKRRTGDLNVTGSRPPVPTRHIRYVCWSILSK